MQASRQIFLSAVSAEFRRCREMLATDLTGPDMPWRVAEQSDFTVGGVTLLEKLDRYIAESSDVVHLIGFAMGSVAKPLEVEAFLKARPAFLSKHPALRAEMGDMLQLSYTQWEAFMALDHEVPLYVFHPSTDFDERPPGFTASEAERAAQATHTQRLRMMGLDRGQFATAERLSSMVLRSFAGVVGRSNTQADQEFAEALEGFARLRESSDQSATTEDSKATIVPFQCEIVLPAHLIVGQSSRIEVQVREPGRTPLEDVSVEFSLGSSTITARRNLLSRGEDARLVGDTQLIPQEAGTPPLKLVVTCSRLSSLRERFEWSAFANVHAASQDAAISATARAKFITRQVQFELTEEVLLPRQGACKHELRPVPAAGRRFEMGSPNAERDRKADEELHPVRFHHSFWMARHPVSQAQFQEIMGRNPSKFASQSAQLPVECVTWEEAVEFCERLTQLEQSLDNLPLGFQYRLPTEAEWEFACRAESTAATTQSLARLSTKVEGAVSHSISTFPLDGNRGANAFGLSDMTGNVFQWCLDGYGFYPTLVEADPCLVGDSKDRVIRGGSWHDAEAFRRPASRAKCAPNTRSSRIGFRVVLARL